MPTPVASSHQSELRPVSGVTLEILSGGRGEPLLVLHDYEYLNEWQPFEAALAEHYTVVVPSHPGCGRSAFPQEFESIDDLAYLYLDLLREFAPARVHLMGLGVGGWIAAEIAVRCTHHLRRLVLVDAVGIKISDPTTRDIADTYIIGPEEFLKLAWHDPAAGARVMKLPGLGSLSEQELVMLFRGRQSIAQLAWKPFMHNPRLRAWLRRIDIPTLVLWGASDRIVTPEYGQTYAQLIPGARFQVLPAAGHYPYLEQPEAFVAAVTAFLQEGESSAPPASPAR
ncbi:MAG TPA: alpha/beta hydrolase [Chloroflexota bacterium]|nr:alpha/beta hydrolase [Chloroflexota bacterium]